MDRQNCEEKERKKEKKVEKKGREKGREKVKTIPSYEIQNHVGKKDNIRIRMVAYVRVM